MKYQLQLNDLQHDTVSAVLMEDMLACLIAGEGYEKAQERYVIHESRKKGYIFPFDLGVEG